MRILRETENIHVGGAFKAGRGGGGAVRSGLMDEEKGPRTDFFQTAEYLLVISRRSLFNKIS